MRRKRARLKRISTDNEKKRRKLFPPLFFCAALIFFEPFIREMSHVDTAGQNQACLILPESI
jgi:hypothetical protein